jgi:hypothetical protein
MITCIPWLFLLLVRLVLFEVTGAAAVRIVRPIRIA